MYVTIVYVSVKHDDVEAFIEATKVNHEASIQEEGNVRFDILQDFQETARFVLYEAYVDQAAAAAHKETAHYAAWRDVVANMMAAPREGVVYDGLFPDIPG